MRKRIATTAAILVMGSATPALAWGDGGHKLVAAIAWEQMSDAARQHAGQLLRYDRDRYQAWTRGAPEAEKDHVAFIMAATWPDYIKFHGGYTKDAYDAGSPVPRQNIGWADRFQHRYWHFKDIPFSTDGTRLDDPPVVNAGERLELFIATLGDASVSRDVRSYDLAWLLHLAGDVHQPLHATSRFTAGDSSWNGPGDGGGNDVTVCVPVRRACPSQTLHSYWDGAFENMTPLDTAAFARAMIAQARGEGLATRESAAAQELAPASWIQQSFVLARDRIYIDPVGPGLGKFRLSLAYQQAAVVLSRQQVMLAGGRIANVLNQTLR